MTKHIFRWLLVLWWFLLILCVAVALATEQFLPVELLNYLKTREEADPTTSDWVLFIAAIPLLVGLIAATIGLFSFKKWARILFVFVHIMSLALIPFSGPAILSESAEIICYFSNIVSGGILFTMYLPPIRSHFETDSTHSAVAESDKY